MQIYNENKFLPIHQGSLFTNILDLEVKNDVPHNLHTLSNVRYISLIG